MKEILNYLFNHQSLSRENAKSVLTNIARGEYNHSQIASFLSVYLMRSITVEELSGFRDALLDLCIPVDLSEFDTIDMCGTGGDGKDTFNISTLASFVVAGAGGKVAKHGNIGVSSTCGSSNVMEYFGYKFSNDPGKLKKEIESTGFCYLHAPFFNPAMKNVAPVRKDLGMKTFFNMLGPMVNPSFPRNQVVGVYSLEIARLYGYIYQQSNKSFAIVYSLDGYDEVSLTSAFKMITNNLEQIIHPGELGMKESNPLELSGGSTIKDAAKIFINVLEGRATEVQENVVLVNAAIGLRIYFRDKSMEECIAIARESLESRKALNVLKKIMDMQ